MSLIIFSLMSGNIFLSIEKHLSALLLTVIFISIAIKNERNNFIPYLLFFSISFTSFVGLTKPLTGSHALSPIPILYGLSFFSASIAYLHKKRQLKFSDIWKVSNPLLLFTGPISLFLKDINYKKLKNRINYFFPFITIGLFYFVIIGSPLTVYMSLVDQTDIVSSILFAIIFEVFVYANFCGLSLLVYGFAGIIGFKIPLNFKQPFTASNIIEFWRGWHTSLSAVLKELFFKPLRNKIGIFFTLIVVYLSSAMWHGISINFLLWGFFHAIIFYATILIYRLKIPFLKFFSPLLMFIAVIFGRLLFADSDYTRLIEKLKFEFVDYNALSIFLHKPSTSLIALLLGMILILIEFVFRENKYIKKRNYKHLRLPISQFILMVIFVLLAINLGANYAIYGQR